MIFHTNKIFYSALFRVCVGLLLLINQLYWIFYSNDFTLNATLNYSAFPDSTFFLFLYDHLILFHSLFTIACILFILGIFGNITSFVIAILYTLQFYLYFQSTDWGENILQRTLLFFCFVNSFEHLSIKTKFKTNNFISSLAVISIMLHILFIYVSNSTQKLINLEWQSGYAFWYFFKSSYASNLIPIPDGIINNVIFIKMLTYFVLIWQSLFLPIMFTNHLRRIWILIGIIMHIGMALILQYYNFEICMVLLLGLFVLDEEWNSFKFLRKLRTFSFSK